MKRKCCRPAWANVLLAIAFVCLFISIAQGVVYL